MTAPLNYQAAADYWRRVAAEGAARPDFAAGVNDRVPESAHRFCRQGQLDYFLREAAGFAEAGAVLDLGCGPGTFALAVAPRARAVLGVDVAPSFVEAAQARAAALGAPQAQFVEGDFVHFAPPGRYDLVILGSTLQYVSEDDLSPLLARVAGALAAGGAVYVRVSIAPRRAWSRGGAYPAVYRTRDDYASAFARAGLSVWREAPDRFYTYGDLFTGYFSALRAATLGASRRWPALEDRLLGGLVALAPLTLGLPESLLRWSRAPVPRLRAWQFVLRGSHA